MKNLRNDIMMIVGQLDEPTFMIVINKLSEQYEVFHTAVWEIVGDESALDKIQDPEFHKLAKCFYQPVEKLEMFFRERPSKVLDLQRVLVATQLLDKASGTKKYRGFRRLLTPKSMEIINSTDLIDGIVDTEIERYIKNRVYSSKTDIDKYIDDVFRRCMLEE